MRFAAVITAAGAIVALGAACLAAPPAQAQDRASAIEAAIKSSWTRTTPEWRERLVRIGKDVEPLLAWNRPYLLIGLASRVASKDR